MLAKLFGSKLEHPMATIKSAQDLIADLPKSDSLKSLMELTDWVESVMGNSDFKVEHQFALVRLLDEASYSYRRKLSREYFAAQELPQFQENRLWLVLGGWYRKAYEAYFVLFNHYYEGDKGSAGLKSVETLLVARTVRLMSATLKYDCLHYGPVDEKIWTCLAVLFKHAERNRYLDTPVNLYSNFPRLSSVRQEVSRLLAWYGCGVTSLTPLAMHLTEHLIAHFNSQIELSFYPTEQSLFGFDLGVANAPHRVNVDTTLHPNMRFVSMSGMSEKLQQLMQILNKQVIPDDLILGGDYDPLIVKEAAEFLLEYVSTLPQRHAIRRDVKVTASVVTGFLQLLECPDSDLNLGAENAVVWHLENISATGFYTILPAQKNSMVRIGSLLGVRPEGLPNWGVAIVRRLMRDNEHRLHVGVEILNSHVSRVYLSQSTGAERFEAGQPALWLHPRADEGETGLVSLLMSRFLPNSSLQTELDGKRYLLIPQGLKKRNQDCDLVEFRLIEREDGEE